MKALPWIVAGVGVGLAVYIIANQPAPQYATGSDDVEDAARKTSLWGSKQRIAGAGGGIVGKIKEGVGHATGDADLADEGALDQTAGAVKDTVGQVANAVGETIHDMNR